MPLDCVARGKLSWELAYPQSPTFHFFVCLSALEEPSIHLWDGGQLAACPGWGWGGRMELPLGGQFRSAVWDEVMGKRDFSHPLLWGDAKEFGTAGAGGVGEQVRG